MAGKRDVLHRLERLSLEALLNRSEDFGLIRRTLLHLEIARAQGYLATQLRFTAVGIKDVLDLPLPRALYPLYPLLRIPLSIWRRIRRAFGVELNPLPRLPATPSPSEDVA